MVLDGDQQAGGFEVGNDAFAGYEAVEAVVGRAGQVDVRGGVEDGDRGEVMTLADGEVVGVVRGRDLHRAGTELRLRPVVGEDGDLAVGRAVDGAEWQRNDFADDGGVACVGRVDGNGSVAEHSFGARGGDDDGASAIGEGIADVVELAEAVFMRDFEVGDGGLLDGVPVDDVAAAIDEVLFVEPDEGFFHGDREPVVHGEVLARPIDGGTEAAHLVGDGRAVLALPLPYACGKGLAAEGLAVGAFAGELAFHHHLRGDAGVVGAGNPQGG